LPGYRFHDYYEAALRVGGDYFDYVALPDGRLAIAVGDVAGKGVPAALLMASLYSTARFHLLTQPALAQALAGLNSQVASGGLGHRFISLVLVVVDPRSHQITIANAGHLPPLLRHRNGNIQTVGLAESGMPLGVIPDQTFRETEIRLEPGELLTLYTDGITEAMNPYNEIYGRARLGDFLSKGPADVDELVPGIVADVEKFCDGRPQRDDLCLVCLQRVS
jgi:serine phosphatase RsbU (regulator of sigma subunit)